MKIEWNRCKYSNIKQERNLPDENKRWLIKQPDREICVFMFVDDGFVWEMISLEKKKKL